LEASCLTCSILPLRRLGGARTSQDKGIAMFKHFLAGVSLALMITLMMTGGAAAEPLEEAQAAYERGDYAAGIRLLRPLADQGDRAGQYNLGIMYREGQGVPRDDTEAAKWFRLAAEQGDAKAQHNLGNMYRVGQGVPQDYPEAAKWFRLAGDQGDANAQYN